MLVPTILCLCVGTLVLFYSLLKFKQWYSFAQKINKLPGRKGYPIIGDVLPFLGSPESVLLELRKIISEFPEVLRGWLFMYPLVALSQPEDLEKLLGSVENNKKAFIYNMGRPGFGDGLLISSGAKWHSRRKLLTPTFHFSILQNFLKIFHKESQNFVKRMEPLINKETDLTPIVTTYTLNSICETAMGTNLDNTEGAELYRSGIHEFGLICLHRVTRAWLMLDFIFRISPTYLWTKRVVEQSRGFSRNIIRERKHDFNKLWKKNEIDLVSFSENRQLAMLDLLLLAQKKGDDIDDEGIQDEVDTFMFEGHDTTAICLTFTLMLLANNRDCQDKMYEEIYTVFGDEDRETTNNDLQELKYTEMCIKESMRLYPSVPFIGRTTGEDILTRTGYVIPKGTLTAACIYDMHRRADLYPDPEKFDPDRFLLENVRDRHPYAYIPFSAGPRNCIGQKFAMMEIKCLVAQIVRKYILEPIDTPKTIRFRMDMVLRATTPIRVRFVPRTTI